MDIKEFFRERAKEFGEEESGLEKLSFRYSTVRILLFLLALFLFVYFANMRAATFIGAVVILFPLLFGWLVSRHNRILRRLKLTRNLRLINEEELRRTEHNFDGLATGEYWLDRKHPYAYDLDIFGKNSLFQLLNRTGTPSGQQHLSSWLLQAASREEALRRQEAVTELSTDIHWNQVFQASGRLLENIEPVNLQRLLKWINMPARLPSGLYQFLSLLTPLLVLISVGLTIAGLITIYIPILLILVNVVILRKFQEQLTKVTYSTSGNAELLRSYAELIALIENRTFTSDMLTSLKEPFLSDGETATGRIQRIRRLADYLNARGNMFYQLVNFVFLLDIHLINAAERWKRKNREDIGAWFSNIGEVEALISLAGFRIANPDNQFPVFTDSATLDVENLGHPLIRPSERVVNDFEMSGIGQVTVITGSNMSGKSTFLRTVGINAVLGYAGSVVCASSMQMAFFRVFTGMRTEDNLEEHISSFYAELKRIRQLLDYIEDGNLPVLYMLDEVLKGTNTRDRHKGSEALIRKLARKNAMGFVSTHDLELGELANSIDSVRNFSFNSEIRGEEIKFTYTIEPGICRSFNASMLMKKIGILDNHN